MFQKLYSRRSCIRLMTLSGVLLVCCAPHGTDSYAAHANPTSSIIVVSGHRTATRNSEPSTTSTLPIDASAANKSGRPVQHANSGERTSLEMIAPQAQAHIDYALNLAERGAVESAQAEFIIALDLIADALDADTKNTTRAHARAVQAGLTAIEETQDFVPADTPHNVVINLAQLASTHQTPVLKNVDMSRMSRAEALQRYHTYATQQLGFAGGHSTIASSALYGLGRAECVTTAGASSRNPLGAPNAMALYQAALFVDPQNYLASNELGVLMARFGDLESSAAQLTHSLSIKPQVEAWHNLATVYGRMGQQEKAEQAEREREKLLDTLRSSGASAQSSTTLTSRPPLQWVDTDTFAATATPYGLEGPAVTSNKSASIAQRDSLGKRLISKLNPWPKPNKPQQNADMTQLNSKSDVSHNGVHP